MMPVEDARIEVAWFALVVSPWAYEARKAVKREAQIYRNTFTPCLCHSCQDAVIAQCMIFGSGCSMWSEEIADGEA
jgi:hypothetical protein